MAEPTLSEITNIQADPMLGGGESRGVIDQSKMVDTLNQNARFYAENVWRKYEQFSKNKAELFKNISDIQGLETAQQDRDYLKDQAADILRDIVKDPSIVTGGPGYAELQGKMAKFKSDAMTSKQDKLDYDADAKFIAANPELNTDENSAMRENFWKAPLGVRKPVMLKMPTLFDEKAAVESLIKAHTKETSEVVGADGKPGKGYVASYLDFDPKAFLGSWNMIAKGGQQDKNSHDLKKAVEERYSHLPEGQKAKYDAAGGIEAYWADKGQQYLNAYYPDGKYRITKDIKADTGYLRDENFKLEKDKFAHAKAVDREQLNQGWARINVEKDKVKDTDKEDSQGALSVLNEAASIINNGEKIDVVDANGKKKSILRISDPTLLQKFGNVDKDGKTVNVPDVINFDPANNQPVLIYYKDEDKAEGKNKKTKNFKYDREIPIDQRTWLKVITQRSFPNKDIGKINTLVEDALKANGNSIFEIAKRLKSNNQAAPAATAPHVMTDSEFAEYLKKKGY